MKARIKWVEDRTFIGESGSGHKIVLGTTFGPEGRSPGPSPMELVLIGLGGCSGYDVVHILEKGREAEGTIVCLTMRFWKPRCPRAGLLHLISICRRQHLDSTGSSGTRSKSL